jgi:hypothetical protein
MIARPAKQPKTNSQDVHAVGIIMTILGQHDRVVPDIKTIDKYSNIDGHVQVKDAEDYPIGTIAVSVKPINVKKDGLSFDCPVSILAYAAIDPTILLGVDKQTQKIYWLYLDSYVLSTIDYENNSSTKRIKFAEDHIISKRHKEYIKHWSAIVDKNRQRLTGYDAQEKELFEILKNTNRLIGKRDEKFIQLHMFIDSFNLLLERDFPTVKKFFYPSAWKVGIAYETYDETELSYSLYPIHISHNDVQIKEIDDSLVETVRQQGLIFRLTAKNPIMTRPSEYAKELVNENVMRLVNNKLLSHKGNQALAKEFIFAFVDKFHVQMGIIPSVKDRENVRVLNFGFSTYFPLWIEEAYRILQSKNRNNINERLARNGYYDPDVLGEMMPEEIAEVQEKVGKRLNQASGSYNVYNKSLNIAVFIEMLNYITYLDSKANIDRLYIKADRSRIAKVGSHWIWDEFSKEDAEKNFRTVFDNLLDAYNQMLRNNFPTLLEQLDLFGKANTIYVHANIKEKYTDTASAPSYKMIFVYEPNKTNKSIKFIDDESAKKYENLIWNSEERKNNPVKVYSAIHSHLDFLYSDTPLRNLIYELLTTRLKEYFQSHE